MADGSGPLPASVYAGGPDRDRGACLRPDDGSNLMESMTS